MGAPNRKALVKLITCTLWRKNILRDRGEWKKDDNRGRTSYVIANVVKRKREKKKVDNDLVPLVQGSEEEMWLFSIKVKRRRKYKRRE